MKNQHLESLGRKMRDYHKSHQWRLSEKGLYIPHVYPDTPDISRLTYWADVGFILNNRRVIVWWVHPRTIYADAVHDKAWDLVGPGPQDSWLVDDATPNYKKLGKSGKRKKIVSYTCRPPSEAQRAHYAKLRDIEEELNDTGINLTVKPVFKCERLSWALGVNLVVPVEPRVEADLHALANLARRLLKQETTLSQEFPDYAYTKEDWLREREFLKQRKLAKDSGQD